MPSSKIKTIIFDFGNVVSFFDHGITLRRIAPYTKLSEQEIRSAIRATNLEDDYESGRLTCEEFLKQLKVVCQLNCEEELLAQAWKDIFRPNPDICNLIPTLKEKNYRLQLGSNTNKLHADHYLEQFNHVLKHMDALTLSHEVGARKPKAGFFADCHEKSGCAAHECLFIDDLAANVEGARAYGFQALVYSEWEMFRKDLLHLGILS